MIKIQFKVYQIVHYCKQSIRFTNKLHVTIKATYFFVDQGTKCLEYFSSLVPTK